MQSQRINYFWIIALPLSFLWAIVSFFRRKWYPNSFKYCSSQKIICIGNIHSGGSGKTPVVFEFLEKYKTLNPVVLSRGYRGALSRQGALVDRNSLRGASDYGDEPWMLAKRSGIPIYIAQKRKVGMQAIQKAHPSSLVLLDDGFQHLALHRDIDVVCINTDKPLERSFCIPLGDLREPMSALNAAGVILLIPGTSQQSHREWKVYLETHFSKIPHFEAVRKFEGIWNGNQAIEDSTGPWAAFSGIAEPKRFELGVKECLSEATYLKAYEDHHSYTHSDIEWLIQERKRLGAKGFITTEKDWYKIEGAMKEQGEHVFSLRVRYELPQAFWASIETIRGDGHPTLV